MQGIITDGVRLEVAKGLARGESRPAVARRVGISNMSISRMVYKPKFAGGGCMATCRHCIRTALI